jgi:putative hydrolase of the HAD superfamily
MINTVIFDYAGVLMPFGGQDVWAEKNKDKFGMTGEVLFELVRKDWHPAEIGGIAAEEYWSRLGNYLNADAAEIKKSIMESFPLDERVINIVRELHEKYITVLLSNQISDWLGEVIEENNFKDVFSYIVTSYDTGFAKPDPKIFEEVIKKTGTNYENCLYIDDREENIKAAAMLGINTLQFVTFEQFSKDLKQFTK